MGSHMGAGVGRMLPGDPDDCHLAHSKYSLLLAIYCMSSINPRMAGHCTLE